MSETEMELHYAEPTFVDERGQNTLVFVVLGVAIGHKGLNEVRTTGTPATLNQKVCHRCREGVGFLLNTGSEK